MLTCIDAGHGGADPGAVDPIQPAECDALYTEEDDLAYNIATHVGDELRRLGHKVVFTRKADSFVSLEGRAQVANNVKADAFVSVHLNAGKPSATGFEAWSYPGSQRSAAMRDYILMELVAELPSWSNRGPKEGNLAVLRRTMMPAVLVECGFVTNPDDERQLHDLDIQKRLGSAIARGIHTWGTKK